MQKKRMVRGIANTNNKSLKWGQTVISHQLADVEF